MKQNTKNTWLKDRITLTHFDIDQPYEPLDLGPIHSLEIDNNMKFIQLKSQVDEYNHEVQKNRESKEPIIHGGMKRHYINTLFLMLHDISQMKDIDVQKRYLDDTYEWASNYEFSGSSKVAMQSRPLTSFTRPTTGTTMTNMRKKLLDIKGQDMNITQTSHFIAPENITFQNLLTDQPRKKSLIEKPTSAVTTKQMTQMAFQKKDFKMMNRTVHSHLEVPQQRLKNYPRRKRLDILIQIPTPHIPTAPKKPKDQVQIMLQNPDFFDDDLNFEEPLIEQTKLPEQQQQPIIQEPQLGIDDIPQIDFGGEPDEDGEPQQIQQQQIADKLAPKIKVYKDFYIPVHDDGVKVSKNRNFRHKNDEIKNVINDVSLVQMVQGDWAKVKSRWRNQMSRRRQVSKMSCRSNLQNVRQNIPSNQINLTQMIHRPETGTKRSKLFEYQKKQYSFRIKNVVDQELKDLKLAHIQQLGNLTTPDEGRPKIRALSAYSHSSYRKTQFSDILIKGRQKLLSELDDQLLTMKRKLASERVSADIQKLRSGLSVGETDLQQLYSDQFPNINGKSLLHNPFFKVSKKKKKKKKKK